MLLVRATHRIEHHRLVSLLLLQTAMKVFALCALAVATYAVDVSEMRLINDQAFVDKINSNPGLLWKVCFLHSGMLLCSSHAFPCVLTFIDMSCVGRR